MNSFESTFDSIVSQVQSMLSDSIAMTDLHNILLSLTTYVNRLKPYLTELAFDEANPYSRKILLNDPNLELMIARWTPNHPCAPHDHGNSYSAILVIEGCSEHKLYELRDGELVCTGTEWKNEGDIILCTPHQIHAMKAHPNLITLHLYSNSIEDMLVFDLQNHRSFVVDGGCGAWVPLGDQGVIASAEGYLSRKSITKERT